jgi:hypothetical protein
LPMAFIASNPYSNECFMFCFGTSFRQSENGIYYLMLRIVKVYYLIK